MKKINDKAIAELEKKLRLKNMNKNKTENMNSYTKKRRKLIKINFLENIIQNHKNINDSLEKTKNSQPNSTHPELKVMKGNKINYKINFKRSTSPNVGHEIGKIKKLIIFNENKNTINPFDEHKDESKIKRPKQIKISEIINNKIISINDISIDKNYLKKYILTQERTEGNVKTKKIIKNPQQHQSERNIYLSKKSKENANETLNKLINKHQKNDQLLFSNNERNTDHKSSEKKKGKKGKRDSKNENYNNTKNGK